MWLPDDTIVFATTHPDTGLMAVPASGGTPRSVTRPDASQGENHSFPVALPGARGLLFVVQSPSAVSSPVSGGIAALDLQTGTYRRVIDGGSRAAYVNGHVVYVSATERTSAVRPMGAMFAVPFDAASLRVTGARVALAPSSVDFAVSQTGTLVSFTGASSDDAGARRDLVWVDRSGRESPTGAPARTYHVVRISPDGRRALVQIADQERDIWAWEFDRRAMTRVTQQEGDEQSPTWLPDGRRFLLFSNTGGQLNLSRHSVDGTGSPERLLSGPYAQMPLTVTPDGRSVVCLQASGTGTDSVTGRGP